MKKVTRSFLLKPVTAFKLCASVPVPVHVCEVSVSHAGPVLQFEVVALPVPVVMPVLLELAARA